MRHSNIKTSEIYDHGSILRKVSPPRKRGYKSFLKRLDSRFHGNDNLGLLQLALAIKVLIVGQSPTNLSSLYAQKKQSATDCYETGYDR